MVLLVILVAGVACKVLGTGGVSRIFGLTSRESISLGSLGFMSASRLSLVLAGAEIGRTLEIIDEVGYSIFFLFSLISMLIGSSSGKFLLGKLNSS